MKRTLLVLGIGLLLTGTVLAQNPAPVNPYQSLVDRLNAMVTVPLDSWKFHPDIPHPEAVAVDDNDWPTVKTGEDWKTGPRVLRKLIEIPATVNGYKTQGARIRLQLAVDSRDFVTITVFSNGSMVSRTDGDTLQPIVLTGKCAARREIPDCHPFSGCGGQHPDSLQPIADYSACGPPRPRNISGRDSGRAAHGDRFPRWQG